MEELDPEDHQPHNGNKSSNTKKYIYQYLIGFTVSLMPMSVSIALGWPSPSIPKIMSEMPTLTNDQCSWFVSIIHLGTVIGALPLPWVIEKYGRKIILLFSALPLCAGWILIATANSIYELYLARFLNGLSLGPIFIVSAIYLGEIASDHIRGSICILLTIMIKMGILFIYTIGPYVSFRVMALIAMAPTLCFVFACVWLPETPYFLLGKTQEDAAYFSLRKLRAYSNVTEEHEKISLMIKKSNHTKGTFYDLLMLNDNRKRLLIYIAICMAQQLCGVQAIIAYSNQIFEKFGDILDPSKASILLGLVQLIMVCVACSLVDRYGRRPLLLISIGGTATCTTIVGIYFLVKRLFTFNVNAFSWLPITAIMIFIITFSIGLAPLPLTFLAEIFPKNVKGKAGVIGLLVMSIISFIVVKLYQIITDTFGSDYTFFTFGTITYIFFVICYYFVPETRRKPLDEIVGDVSFNK